MELREMHLFRLSSFPIEQVTDLEALERALGAWCAGVSYPWRLLALSRRFDMRRPIDVVRTEQRDLERLQRIAGPLLAAIDGLVIRDPEADPGAALDAMELADVALLMDLFAHNAPLQHALAEAPATSGDTARVLWSAIGDALDTLLWRLPWLKETTRFYETLQHGHLRSAAYVLIAWPPPDVSADSIAATLRHATGRPVTILDQLPSVLDGPYQEQATVLRPEQSGAPWLTALLGYDARGSWDATTLHALLDVPYDVAIAIDVHTLSRNQAMRAAEMAYNAARVVARDAQIVDVRAQRVIGAAERVMHELVNESLHTVQIAVLVAGATEEELETHVAETRGRLGPQLRLLRPAGAQGEALKLWSATPRGQIDAPCKPRTVLSHGAGCCLGVLGYHRASDTDGLFWGLDAVRRAPLFFDLFRNNQAAHMVILGKTGFGKTFFLNLLALRSAALAGYRVIGIDAFHNGQRVEAAARGGARCDTLTLETAINILDIAYGSDDEESDWRPSQVQHVIGQLGLLLGTPARTPDGRAFYQPRPFTIGERGVLDRALTRLYAGMNPRAPLSEMPLLTDLIDGLEHVGMAEARALVRELRLTLFGSDDPSDTTLNSMGRRFNAHTAVDWTFGHDITYFDFAPIHKGAEELLPFYYAQAIGAINRYMRDPARDRSRRTLLQIDEFGYLTQVEALAQLAATICKVARKYGIGLVAIDQNPATFLGSAGGRAIFENAVAKALFHLDDLPAREVGAAISDLTPAHVGFLSHAGVGECLAVVGNDVYVMTVEANPRELRALRGS
jgi:hypothetical protein